MVTHPLKDLKLQKTSGANSMTQQPPLDEDLSFNSELSVDVKFLLEEARRCCRDKEKTIALLQQAQALAPDKLEVYFRHYKYLFYNKRLPEAEEVARQGLSEAARQINISPDCLLMTPDTADWKNSQGTERFYLFTMKALAFILLRQQRQHESEAILKKIAELDPDDQVGSSVIRDLALSLREQSDAA